MRPRSESEPMTFTRSEFLHGAIACFEAMIQAVMRQSSASSLESRAGPCRRLPSVNYLPASRASSISLTAATT